MNDPNSNHQLHSVGRRPARTKSLRLEALEDRITPDATIVFSNNLIDVVGTGSRDVVLITSPQPDRVHVKVTTGTVVVQRMITGIDKDTRIEVFGGAGNDLIDNRVHLPMRAFGSTGNDTILGGSGDDELRGNEGDDLIRGRRGNDLLSGNEGSDQIFGGAGHDEIHGDNGSRAAYNNGSQLSTGSPDFLDGGIGHDAIFGNGGDDRIEGGDGNDWLDGQGGNDEVVGHIGHDSLFGGTEDDMLLGGAGHDLLDGYHGNDLLIGHGGNDDLRGDLGDDELRGMLGNDVLAGGGGNDLLYGDEGADSLDGSSGDDLLEGGIGNDELFGGAGIDSLLGHAGNDLLEGGQDNDILSGHAGNDYLNGGNNDDHLFGSAGNDELHGGSENDTIDGGGGDDELFGQPGSDQLFGRAGNDLLDGGDGNDILHGDDEDDPVGGRDRLFGGPGIDQLFGHAGNDHLEGGDNADELFGHNGNDYLLDDNDGDNTLDGGPGTNRIEYFFLPGELHAYVADDARSLRLAGTDRKFHDSGFTLLTGGTWQTTSQSVTGGTRYTYSTAGNVYIDLNNNRQLDTVEDLLIRQGMTLYSRPASSADAAVIDPASMSFTLLPTPLTDFLESIKQTTGLEIGLPSISVGMASGHTLMQSDETLPLRESQPYLYFTVTSGLTLKFGSVELTSNAANNYLPQGSFTLIVDPTDVFVFAKATGGGVGAAVGVSTGGRIPFRPAVDLEHWTGNIFGHVHLDLIGVPLPKGFSVDGTVLLDLDANDDGKTTLDMAKSLATVAPEGNFWNRLGETLDDISAGINGKLYFGDFDKHFPKGSFLNKLFTELDTSVELARGSVVLDGRLEEIHFKGEKTNPFKDTPLESLDFLNQKLELSGSVTSLKSDPRVQIDFRAANLVGPLQTVGLSLNNDGARFRGDTDVLGQSLHVSGSISTSGVITLDGSLRVGGHIISDDTGKLGAGIYLDVHAQASIAALKLNASISFEAWVNALSYNFLGLPTGFTGELYLKSTIDLGLSGGTFSFNAGADLSLYILGIQFRAAPSFTVMVGPNSFAFNVLGHDVEITW